MRTVFSLAAMRTPFVARVFAAVDATEAEIEEAKAGGAAWMAWAESEAAMATEVAVANPREVRSLWRASNARWTRFLAASSEMASVTAISAEDW